MKKIKKLISIFIFITLLPNLVVGNGETTTVLAQNQKIDNALEQLKEINGEINREALRFLYIVKLRFETAYKEPLLWVQNMDLPTNLSTWQSAQIREEIQTFDNFLDTFTIKNNISLTKAEANFIQNLKQLNMHFLTNVFPEPASRLVKGYAVIKRWANEHPNIVKVTTVGILSFLIYMASRSIYNKQESAQSSQKKDHSNPPIPSISFVQEVGIPEDLWHQIIMPYLADEPIFGTPFEEIFKKQQAKLLIGKNDSSYSLGTCVSGESLIARLRRANPITIDNGTKEIHLTTRKNKYKGGSPKNGTKWAITIKDVSIQDPSNYTLVEYKGGCWNQHGWDIIPQVYLSPNSKLCVIRYKEWKSDRQDYCFNEIIVSTEEQKQLLTIEVAQDAPLMQFAPDNSYVIAHPIEDAKHTDKASLYILNPELFFSKFKYSKEQKNLLVILANEAKTHESGHTFSFEKLAEKYNFTTEELKRVYGLLPKCLRDALEQQKIIK